MEVQAILKNFRMSPQKVREVVRQVQGLKAEAALSVLKMVSRKSARAVAKTLASAIANAENNHGLKREKLIVHRAYAQTAGSIKRFIPKARGSAGPILKRSSHIKIILTES
ncbi:MAG: 50S ribosomal protein L22 [Pedosphaera sp.]|nr:50S ribosomal protein L22 [Pedosphaera sp.]